MVFLRAGKFEPGPHGTDTKAKLTQFQQTPSDPTPISGLTKEDLTGDIVQTGIVGYFAQVDANDKLSARTAGTVVSYRLPSYGRFFTVAQPYYWWGVVRKVSFPGLVMDVDYLFQQDEAKDMNHATRTNFMRQLGVAGSAAEHAVPELMFADSTKPLNDPSQPQGVSAVKALAIAAAQGQKIYTLNPGNQAIHTTVLSSLQISQDVKAEIANALAAGKEVTVHEKDITVNGWTGNGYIMLDPDTGAGAYKIAGGSNGGFLATFIATVIAFLIVFLVAFPAGLGIGLLMLSWETLNLFLWIKSINAATNDDEFNKANAGQFFGSILGFFPMAGVALAEIVKWFGLLWVLMLTNFF